jgi:hypothetical protein
MKAEFIGYRKTQHSGVKFDGRVIRSTEQMHRVSKCDMACSGIKPHFKCIYTNVKEDEK